MVGRPRDFNYQLDLLYNLRFNLWISNIFKDFSVDMEAIFM